LGLSFNLINIIFFLFILYKMAMFDVTELIKRIIKYLIEGLMVAIAAFAIPKRSLNLEEIALIALTAAATFAILDTYIPSMGVTARSGAGFGIGANLVGFPGGL
jgi:ABC-type Co2+ transport system permease subunit